MRRAWNHTHCFWPKAAANQTIYDGSWGLTKFMSMNAFQSGGEKTSTGSGGGKGETIYCWLSQVLRCGLVIPGEVSWSFRSEWVKESEQARLERWDCRAVVGFWFLLLLPGDYSKRCSQVVKTPLRHQIHSDLTLSAVLLLIQQVCVCSWEHIHRHVLDLRK